MNVLIKFCSAWCVADAAGFEFRAKICRGWSLPVIPLLLRMLFNRAEIASIEI
jgi:hypothetical protein